MTAPVIDQTMPTPTAHAPSSIEARRRRLGPGRPIRGGPLIGPLLLLTAWTVASATGVLDPRVLSEPWTVAQTAVELTLDGRLGEHLAISTRRAGIGLALGVLAGLMLALFSG